MKPSDKARTKNKHPQDASETMTRERVKRELTTEEVIKRWKEGWRFVKKKRGDSYQIIARRKNLGKDESMGYGHCSDERWAIIENAEKNSSKGQSRKNLADDIKTHIHQIMNRECLHKDEEGFCMHWVFEKPPESINMLDSRDAKWLFKETVNEPLKPSVWLMNPIFFICRDCPAYIDEKMLSFIEAKSLDKTLEKS
jgi:hypothetical protein